MIITDAAVSMEDLKTAGTIASQAGRSGRREVPKWRTDVQRRASANIRRHGLRTLRRVGILLAADISSLLLASVLLDQVAGQALLGPLVASQVTRLFPLEVVVGWPFSIAVVIGLAVTGCYGEGDRRHHSLLILLSSTLATLLVFWDRLWAGQPVAVLHFVTVLLSTWALITLIRACIHRVVIAVRHQWAHAPQTVLVGPTDDCVQFSLSPIFQRRFRLIGWLTPDGFETSQVLGGYDKLAELIGRGSVDTVVLCGHLRHDDFEAIVDVSLAGGCELLSLGRTPDATVMQSTLVTVQGVPLVALARPALKAHQLVVKRALDVAISLVAIVVLAPLFIVISCAIKATSKGPVLFRQRRVGLGARKFEMFKFRSMRPDAEQLLETLRARSIYSDSRLFKLKKDPRVTAIGAFLRRTSLDELPQLFNVLRGEMSLVGPRPPTPNEVALYEEHHYCRFDVKPGITGPWQVGGRNLITDFEDVIRLEQAYIREWTLGRDFSILVRTVPAVLKMNGAH